MGLVQRHVGGWPTFGWPKNRHQLFELAGGQEWLQVKKFHEGGTLVVRAELPDIDPHKDVEITSDDPVVRIHTHHEQATEHKQVRAPVLSSVTGSSSVTSPYPKGASAKDVRATYEDGTWRCRSHVRRRPSRSPRSPSVGNEQALG
jgi:HSP20 family protein